MKRYLIMAICLVCSFLSEKVDAQISLEQKVQVLNSDANQQIQDLILRSTREWTAAGYTVMCYQDFVSQSSVPNDAKDRLQLYLYRYANKNFDQVAYSFVIYKMNGYICNYELRVLEDCPAPIIPQRYTLADKSSFSF